MEDNIKLKIKNYKHYKDVNSAMFLLKEYSKRTNNKLLRALINTVIDSLKNALEFLELQEKNNKITSIKTDDTEELEVVFCTKMIGQEAISVDEKINTKIKLPKTGKDYWICEGSGDAIKVHLIDYHLSLGIENKIYVLPAVCEVDKRGKIGNDVFYVGANKLFKSEQKAKDFYLNEKYGKQISVKK